MQISPDSIIWIQLGPVPVNATILFTWLVMALMVLVSWLVTRRLSTEGSLPRWQHVLEVVVLGILGQIREVSHQKPERLLPFLGLPTS